MYFLTHENKNVYAKLIYLSLPNSGPKLEKQGTESFGKFALATTYSEK